MIESATCLESKQIQLALEGDQNAYEELVRSYQEIVFRFAYLITQNAEDAADVTQDTFIRAWNKLNQFDRTRPFRPWILQIAKNTAYNRQRSVGRYLKMIQRTIIQTPQKVLDPEHEVANRLESEVIREAISQLRPVDQEIIYLRYFLELSVNETAEVLEIETGTVKSRLSRALARLREIVEQDFPLLLEGRQI